MSAREKMTVHVPDRFKAANAFWIGLAKIGLTPAAVLTHARLPLAVYNGKKNFVTTAQFFALWRAVGELSAEALRNGDDLAEKLHRFETLQLQMGFHLRDFGVRAGNQSQFPHG